MYIFENTVSMPKTEGKNIGKILKMKTKKKKKSGIFLL